MPSTPSTRRLLGDRYDLLEEIGRGGMGVVWRARDTLLQRDVAVKEIQFPPGTTEDERVVLRQRVFREARAAARLAHPSVVTVYDVIEEDGQPFIVMEYIDAPSLTDVVRTDGPLAPARAAAIGLDVLSALEVAHAAGVVHRDIKPSNVMVPARGHCELADFGIASVQDDPSVTSTGLVLGSPAYMAPEQGSRGLTSAASDLWSLGATLFFAVEGMPPFAGDGALPTLSAVMNDEPQPMRRAGELASVILALLDKDPARRPSHAVVRAELEGVMARGSAAVGGGSGIYPIEPHAEDTLALVRTNPAGGTPISATAALPPVAAPVLLHFADDSPALGPPPTRVDAYAAPRRERRGGMLVAIVVIAALIAGALYGFTRLGRKGTPKARSTSSAAAPAAPSAKPKSSAKASASPTPSPSASPTVSPSASPTPPASSAPAQTSAAPVASSPAVASSAPASSAISPPAAAAAPVGWVTYTDSATGFAISKPASWVVTRNGVNTDFKDPASGAYMRVAYTRSPGADATQAWRDYEPSFAARHPGYHQIALQDSTYRGMPAGYWEYTYGRQRAVDLGFVLPNRSYGFALNYQAPQSLWTAAQPTFDAFKASFRPPA